jgi:hypothetical protein
MILFEIEINKKEKQKNRRKKIEYEQKKQNPTLAGPQMEAESAK